MSVAVKFLTLNCWGVPTRFACRYRLERMEAIGKEIAKGDYDVVLLQEIWAQSDYKGLCSRICDTLKYTHYFHSGLIGSGLCIFSKLPILETFQHNFTLNGYAHKVVHGDWFCGKSVGLAKLRIGNFNVNVYITHTHAEYSRSGLYGAHRLVQAYQLSQFVKMTSDGCDAVIIGGDFNFKPVDLGYKMICSNANLKDAWTEQKESPGHVGTADRPDNTFSSNSSRSDGHCLDFIMFRNNTGSDVTCGQCSLTMRKIPELGYNYSDHEGVTADFTFLRNPTVMGKLRDRVEVEKHFTETLPLLDDGIKNVKADQIYYLVALVLTVVVLVLTACIDVPVGVSWLLALPRCGLVLMGAFCFWSGVVLVNREMNEIIAARSDITNMLRSNHGVFESTDSKKSTGMM